MVDLLLGLLDRRGLDALGLQPGIALQSLEGGGQVIIHKVVELIFLLGPLIQNRKDLPGQILDPVDLPGDLLVGDQVVVRPDLPQDPLVAGDGLLLLLLGPDHLVLGILGQHQPVGLHIQPGRLQDAPGDHLLQVLDDLVVVDPHDVRQIVDGHGGLVADQLEIGLKALFLLSAQTAPDGGNRAARH